VNIFLFNTLAGKKEAFQTIDEGRVGFYSCGPTVYDYAHIGNFRTFVAQDLLRRFLEQQGYHVRHVMNLTDVDDKTIAGANQEKKKLEEFTEPYVAAFQNDLNTLNILQPNYPDKQPRATQEIPEMIQLIQKLIQKNAAYEREGSVYYRVASFPEYGKLSKKDLGKNVTGVRVDVDEYEREEATDFVLWKKSKENEPSWDSPWGGGRPGWHIECSAMSMKYLGTSFDLHSGGEDLIFPHHENEIAQSEGATGRKPFVRHWIHVKHLLVDGEKMSKSKGNFFQLKDLLEKGYDPMAIRYSLLSVHYGAQLNFTLQGLKEAGEVIKKLDDCYFQCLTHANRTPGGNKSGAQLGKKLDTAMNEIVNALCDDLNISKALALFHEAVGLINRTIDERTDLQNSAVSGVTFFNETDRLFGFDISKIAETPSELLHALLQREEVRGASDFKQNKELQKKSDELRDNIGMRGWFVKDLRPGEPSTLKKKRRVWDGVQVNR
jgi:cysteinyl-tRNA synthetase